jgi:hypothetical protein
MNTPPPPDRTRAACAAVIIARDPLHRDRPGRPPHRSDSFLTGPRAADGSRDGAGQEMRRDATVPRSRDPAAPAFAWFGSSPAPEPRGGARRRPILARKTSYTVSPCRHGRSDSVRPSVCADRMCANTLCNVKTGGAGYRQPMPVGVRRTSQRMTGAEWWRPRGSEQSGQTHCEAQRFSPGRTPCNVSEPDSGCRGTLPTAVRGSNPRRAS